MGILAVYGIHEADKGGSAGFIALIDTGIFQHFREDPAGLFQQNVQGIFRSEGAAALQLLDPGGVARQSRDGGIVMQSKHNKQLVPFAKQLRKEMTKEERHLWYDFLRTYPVLF